MAQYNYMPFGREWIGEVPQSERQHIYRMSSVALGICLLACDSEFVKPILLKRDRAKELTVEQRLLAIKRARSRGNFGFEFGVDMRISPHFRRPHFALRWTGKGKETPRLVPVKGCVVNRSELEKVPTGYEG